jgi:colanic acid/amylovoran biosynthesis glycosyltransferase
LIIGKWMQGKGLTHIHVHFANPAATVAMILCKIYPYTYSISVHGPDEFYEVTNLNLKHKFEDALFIRTIGKYAQSQVMRLCAPAAWHKIEVVPLGIDLKKFTPNKIPPNNERFEVLSVSRVTPNKGQHILIESIDQLKKQGRDVNLRLIGDGPAMNDLKKAVEEKQLESSVIFEGAQGHGRVIEAYKCCDLFVLASFSEGIPVVLMEAMAMEVPCIATHINGIPELIGNNLEGILVIPSDDKSLSNSISQLMDDPTLRKQLGISGRRRVAEKYNLHLNILRLATIFQKYLVR